MVAAVLAAGILAHGHQDAGGAAAPRSADPAAGSFVPLFDRYSFPSGHAVFYTAFFGALAFLLWRRFTGAGALGRHRRLLGADRARGPVPRLPGRTLAQ